MNTKLLIIDLNNIIFRAYYGIYPNIKKDHNVNAVFGTLNMLFKMIKKYKPTNVLIALESETKLKRLELYPQYKMNRSEKPEDLVWQIVEIKRILAELGFNLISRDGFEADDVIGSVVTQWKKKFQEILIETKDKDLYKYAEDNVYILDSKNDKKYSSDYVEEKFGVKSDQISDYLAIVGDSSDNIPGIKGVGPKTASKLLKEFGSYLGCIDNVSKMKESVRKKFQLYEKEGYLSLLLAKITEDLDLCPYIETKLSLKLDDKLIFYFEELNFYHIIKLIKSEVD